LQSDLACIFSFENQVLLIRLDDRAGQTVSIPQRNLVGGRADAEEKHQNQEVQRCFRHGVPFPEKNGRNNRLRRVDGKVEAEFVEFF
jgi:hypothetical protein